MDARTTWPALLSALIRGDSLTADESEWAMNEIMEGVATPSQIAGFGVALRIKGTSVAEMTGLARSMLSHATPIEPARSADRPGGHGRGRGAHGQRVDDGHDRGGGRGRADDQARQPGRVVRVRGGRRARGPRRGDRPAAGQDRRTGRRGRRGLPVRAAVPPGAAVRGPDPQRARRAHRVQLPRPGGQPGPARRRRRSGCSTRGWARSSPACWPGAAARPWCSAATTGSTS